MKKLAVLLLAATCIFSACHNEGSSTVGVYDSDEPAQQPASQEEGRKDTMKSEEHATGEMKEHADTTHVAMPAKAEEKKDTAGKQ